jgi:hypothetical protein
VARASAGFKEGVNVVYDRQNAQGDMARAEAIARQFVTDRVDLIHTIATPTTQAVLKTRTDIPVVFSGITHLIQAGIVPRGSVSEQDGQQRHRRDDPGPCACNWKPMPSLCPRPGSGAPSTTRPRPIRYRTCRVCASRQVPGLELIEATTNAAEVELAAKPGGKVRHQHHF